MDAQNEARMMEAIESALQHQQRACMLHLGREADGLGALTTLLDELHDTTRVTLLGAVARA